MAKNLVNGTLTTIQENGDDISIQINFPIGYIYLSTNSINPSLYFGGTWKRIAKGKTLVGVDEIDNDFSSAKLTGGEKEHTLTVDEIPSHSHDIGWSQATNLTDPGQQGIPGQAPNNRVDGWKTFSTGGNQPHNNMQPYFTCYIWEKTAL